ncbi:hypothetical protein GF357_02180 [Candidatus Dojkabacteria bacterium]|nr:hypothetical protein [Candidatus Dojkabacteria bacterium]
MSESEQQEHYYPEKRQGCEPHTIQGPNGGSMKVYFERHGSERNVNAETLMGRVPPGGICLEAVPPTPGNWIQSPPGKVLSQYYEAPNGEIYPIIPLALHTYCADNQIPILLPDFSTPDMPNITTTSHLLIATSIIIEFLVSYLGTRSYENVFADSRDESEKLIDYLMNSVKVSRREFLIGTAAVAAALCIPASYIRLIYARFARKASSNGLDDLYNTENDSPDFCEKKENLMQHTEGLHLQIY